MANVDYFDRPCDSLKLKKLFLLDMDGTICIDSKLIDGAEEFLQNIKKNGGRYVFITNNSSKSVKDYMMKLNGMGITASEDEFFTSSQATAVYINRNHKNKLVYCMGTKSLVEELENNGINVTTELNNEIELILIGFDTELTAEKLRKTCLLLNRDLPYIATNCDLVCPVDFGYIPDCGSYAQMLYNATNKMPKFIGKPECDMINFVVEKFSATKDETVVIGDRLYTDISAGINSNVDSICVLSGEATVHDINNGSIKPTYTFPSVKDVSEVL